MSAVEGRTDINSDRAGGPLKVQRDVYLLSAPNFVEFESGYRNAEQPDGLFASGRASSGVRLRVPTKPAMHSNSKPAGYSNRKPATLGVNRMGRFDDVVEG
jgi:hypothetical protein